MKGAYRPNKPYSSLSQLPLVAAAIKFYFLQVASMTKPKRFDLTCKK